MEFLHVNRTMPQLRMVNPEKPELFREFFPYTRIGRVSFDDTFIMPRPADPMFITDTTFRDGQQARPPYSSEQIEWIFDALHRLGGFSGLIRQCEFFLYSDKDKRAVERCMAKDFDYPQITGWIRANKEDLKIVRDMGIKETGMLTSVSDYHVYLKLGKDRKRAVSDYLEVIDQALEWGITPRCHFEDVTRADIYGFCIPFAQELMKRSKEAGLPVKIRLCDTLGFGVPYPGAGLPRSVPRLVRTFTDEAGVPGKWLEWHGHNDFHKALINTVTAWLYGCSGANGTLLGFGERTGNAPLEALIFENISLTGAEDDANTKVATEIAAYFKQALGYPIPSNYPLVGRDFNATSAGIHVDGLIKNEEIYNIFDTKKILNRPVPIIITDKSGKAGVAYWINENLGLESDDKIDKRHPAVGKIYKRIMASYERGRTTSFSNQEMRTLVKRFLPELFVSEFDHLKEVAHELAGKLVEKLAEDCKIHSRFPDKLEECMEDFLEEYGFIQYIYLVNLKGRLVSSAVAHPEDRPKYKTYDFETDFSDREWFIVPMESGKLHITDFYKSFFTGKLCLTVATPVTDEEDEITGVLGADIRFEDLLKRQEDLEDEIKREDGLTQL